MYKAKLVHGFCVLGFLAIASCKIPSMIQTTENKTVPAFYANNGDTSTMASISWRKLFKDQHLVNLIDTALTRNQELNITLQEIEAAKNDVLFRQGALLPSVRARLGIGLEKVGRYTSQGAGDASTDIKPGLEVPQVLMDYSPALYATWEIDIWKKLRNAKKAAIARYLSTIEGRNFALTNLVAEVANSYYELLSLDNQLQIVRQNIGCKKTRWK